MLLKRLLICSIILFIISIKLLSQEERADTKIQRLILDLETATDQTLKLHKLDTLTILLNRIHPDSSLHYTLEGLDLARKLGSENYIGLFLQKKATIYQNKNLESAISFYLEAEPYLKDSSLIFRNYVLIAETYFELSDIGLAQKYFDLALKNFDSERNIKWKMYFLNKMALVYNDLREFDAAIEYYKKVIDISKGIGFNTYSLGSYVAIGNIYRAQNNLDSAEYYLNTALENKDSLSQYGLVQLYNCIGEVWRLQGKNGKAKLAYETAWSNAQHFVGEEPYSTFCVDYAYYLNETKRYKEGFELAKKGLDIAAKSGSRRDMSQAYEEMAYSLEQMKDYEKAYLHQGRYMQLKDSLINIENKAIIKDLQFKYDTKGKEEKLAVAESELSRQNLFNGILAALAILFIASTLLFWYFAQQRKKINKRLRDLDERKTQFFTNISHELKTPLTLILAPIENALLNTKNKLVKRDIQLARKHSLSLQSLVNEILDFGRLESGYFKNENKEQNFESFIKRVYSSYRSLARERDIMLEFLYRLPENTIVESDYNKLEKILNNLLSNALKFCNDGGSVTLQVSHEHERVMISIQDTGIGISNKDQQKVFERYYQVKGNNQGGTGIGLSFTRELVKSLGGDITLQSSLGKGSIFSFNFVAAKLYSKNSDEFTDSELIASDNGLPTVLIVEDHKDMSDFIRTILNKQYNCLVARDGEMGLDIIKTKKIDLITSDIMMPNMDGFQFMSELGKLNLSEKIPIIFLSAKSMDQDKLRSFRLGVDDYITKPFSPNELIARIENLLSNKSKRESYKLKERDLADKQLSYDEQLIVQAHECVLEHLSDNGFKVSDLAKALNYSQRQLERIIKRETGMTPNAFIRDIRLTKANELISNRTLANISEVRYAVGFENASYFTKKFSERFGISPKELQSKQDEIIIDKS